MSRHVWESLDMNEQNRIRRATATTQKEAMAHVGRELERALTVLPKQGPVTVDAGWLRAFAKNCQEGTWRFRNSDYIFERAIQSLDQEAR